MQGGARGTDGEDLTALWSALVAWTPKPGAWKLTEQRRKHLRARIADHDVETVERVALWVATSADDRAVFLRKRNDPDTLLRRERFDTYAGMSTQTAPAVASPMHRTALAAWDRYIAPLLSDRRYHSQAPPPAYHADPAKHEVIRRAMYAAGGWGHLSKVRDRAEDVAAFRQTFTVTLARELECAA